MMTKYMLLTTIRGRDHNKGGGLDDDDHNPQHPACPLFTFGGVEGNSLLPATEMD